MRVARQVGDRPYRDTGQRQIDNELRQALIAVLRRAGGAHQRDHVMAMLGVGGPDLAPRKRPAAVCTARGPRPHAGQVRAGIRFAHADAEEGFAAANARQIEAALRLAAELADLGTALPIGDPVGRHRRPGAQQLLDQDEARERVHLGAAIRARQRHADPAARRQLAAEAGVKAHPRTRAPVGRQRRQFGLEKGLDVLAKRLRPRRQFGEFESVYQCAHDHSPMV